MKTRLLIVEDQSIMSADLIDRISSFFDFEVFTARDFTEAQGVDPDIAICDIQLQGDKDGVQVSKWLNGNKCVPVIFITKIQDDSRVYEEIAKLKFPTFYLAKPVTNNALRLSMQNALKELNSYDGDHQKQIEGFSVIEKKVLLKNGTGQYVIDVEKDIIYLEANRETTKVYITTYHHPLIVAMHLKEFLLKLTELSDKVVRSSRSCAINLLKVQQIKDSKRNLSKNKYLQLEGVDGLIPLGAKYRADFMVRFKSL